MSEKLVLIDGHSILNRAFFGLPDLTNAEGLHTNAIYGFLNILFKLLEEEKPEYLAVAFDVHAPTFRHEIYSDYKGTRKPMAEELRQQVPVMKQMLTAMGIPILERAGLEADDILGTLAKQAQERGLEVSLVSGDRDLLQIADTHIKIRIPKTKQGRTEMEDYYPADVEAAFGVNPVQFIELKALMGDTADNIPGVPKVGKVTAEGLMKEYGSMENIYAHLDEIPKKSVRESLAENRALADLSKVLATIKIDCDISLDYEAARAEGFYTPEAYELCKRLEFKNILSRFDTAAKAGASNEEIVACFHTCAELADFLTVLKRAETLEQVGLWLPTEPSAQLGTTAAFGGRLFAAAISLSDAETYMYVPKHAADFVQLSLFDTPSEETDEIGPLTEALRTLSGKVQVATFDVKKEYAYLAQEDVAKYFDILIAAYLLNPLKNDYDLEAIASEHLGILIPGRNEVLGKCSYEEAYAKDPAKVAQYLSYGAYVARRASSVLQDKLMKNGMEKLFTEVEMPLSYVLYDMEREGIAVKRAELAAYGEALVGRISELETSIHTQAGEPFNINSPKQLGEILFEKMGLPGGKKTKTGYSTAADVLEKLAADQPIVRDILEYRTLTKLKSTYADGLAGYIAADGRIHTNFNQTITATGRISSTEPNLQNIPTRMELGRQIRKVFVPKEGCIFLDADYSQIELRVLAHMSADEQLIDAYRQEQDIHRITASKVFHTPFEEVTPLQRRNAKAVNFGIVYGISSFGLSQDLSISKKEAAEYIEQYFATYPKVKEFLDRLVKDAKEKGYTETLFGRRRPIPEIASSNFMQRSFGERVAMNAPIQGTAADIIKIAMIRVWKGLKDAGLRSRLLLQVHDELLIETYMEEEEQVRQILEENMRAAAELSVTLEVDTHAGANWYEAK